MIDAAREILTRAHVVLTSAQFCRVAASTAAKYRAVAARLLAERAAEGAAWRGPAAANAGTAAVRRAAWARKTHWEVALAFRDLRERRCSVEVALARLEEWVPLAEACRPGPARTTDGLARGRPPRSGASRRSKRTLLAELPNDWLDTLWRAAESRGYRHLDALAVLLASGCRPVEACRGVCNSAWKIDPPEGVIGVQS